MAIRLELAVSHALEHKSDVQYSVPVGSDQWMSSQITILFEKIIGSNGVCGLLLRINVYDFNQTKKNGILGGLFRLQKYPGRSCRINQGGCESGGAVCDDVHRCTGVGTSPRRRREKNLDMPP